MGISDTIWLALIGVVVMCLKEYFDRRRAAIAEAKSERIEAVAVAAAAAAKARDVAAAEHLMDVKDTLVTVQAQTDGLAKELAISSGRVGFAAGVADEKSKAPELVAAIKTAVQEGLAEGKQNGSATASVTVMLPPNGHEENV